ncbi:hypothetical protein THAOC_09586, partial [Thalassiosira oceanica]
MSAAISNYGPIEAWDVSAVELFNRLFVDDNNSALPGADTFNADISEWDVSRGTSFYRMFGYAYQFNQDISSWDVSRGTSFSDMFYYARSFNQDISGWVLSSGGSFGRMFLGADEFNQDISGWDVSRGTSFYAMFYSANEFNQDISQWDVSRGTDFRFMFTNEFNQNLCAWGEHYSSDKNYASMFGYSDCPDTSDPTGVSGPWCQSCVVSVRSMPGFWVILDEKIVELPKFNITLFFSVCPNQSTHEATDPSTNPASHWPANQIQPDEATDPPSNP